MITHSLIAKARINQNAGQSAGPISTGANPKQLTQTIQDLLARIAALEARLANIERAVTVGDDGSVTIYAATDLVLYAANHAQLMGVNRLTLATSVASIEAVGSNLTLTASEVEVNASEVDINAAMFAASGVVQCDTLMANSVVGKSYTPGAGNVW